MEKQTIKQKIESEYGNINKFVETVRPKLKMSVPHFYKLINHKTVNPTVDTMRELSELLNIPLEEVMLEFATQKPSSLYGDEIK
jgi:hypothetical protein